MAVCTGVASASRAEVARGASDSTPASAGERQEVNDEKTSGDGDKHGDRREAGERAEARGSNAERSRSA